MMHSIEDLAELAGYMSRVYTRISLCTATILVHFIWQLVTIPSVSATFAETTREAEQERWVIVAEEVGGLVPEEQQKRSHRQLDLVCEVEAEA